jgi:hypothetical protein
MKRGAASHTAGLKSIKKVIVELKSWSESIRRISQGNPFKTFRGFRAKNIQHFNYLFIVERNFPYHFTPRGYHIVAPTYFFLKAISLENIMTGGKGQLFFLIFNFKGCL